MFLKMTEKKNLFNFLAVLNSIKRRRVSPVRKIEKMMQEGISLLSDGKSMSRSLALFTRSLKLSSELYPSLPFNEFLLRSEVSLALFNNGFRTLSNDYLRSASEALIHEPQYFSTQKLFTLYQNLGYLYFKQEDLTNSEIFTQKALSLLSFQPAASRVKFLLTVIFCKLSEKNYAEALKFCQSVSEDLSLLSTSEINIMQVKLFTVSCLKGLNKLESALEELLSCVDFLVNNKSARRPSFLKLTFLSLADVYASLNQGSEAIQAVITGAGMLGEVEEQDIVLEYLKDAWELVEDQAGIERIKRKIEDLNEKLYGNSVRAVDILSMLSKNSFFNEDFEEAVRLRFKMLNVYKMNNLKEFYFDTYSIISSLYLKFNLRLAKTYIGICDNLVKSDHPNSSEHLVNMLWFKFYKIVGDAENASKYFNSYLKTFPDDKNRHSRLLDDYFDYSDFISSQNRFTKSIESYEKALDLTENVKIMKNQMKINIFRSIGVIRRKMRDFETSLEFLFKSDEIKTARKEAEAGSEKFYHELMATYLAMNEFQLALFYAHENLKLLENQGLRGTANSAVACYNIGYVYEKLLDRPKAIEFYLKAKEIFRKLKDYEQVRNLIENIRVLEE
jgi:tetratricopeptide (TPR) repeat protein